MASATDLTANVKQVRIGLILAILTTAYGFGLGGLFGLIEDDIKGHLKAEAKAVEKEVYKSDAAAMKKVTDKSWQYVKRAHMHGSGIGTTAVCLILALALLPGPCMVKRITAVFLGLGGLGYSVAWLLAALRAPGLGSTGAAKESLKLLAMPSAGMCLLGVGLTLVLLVAAICRKCKCNDEPAQ